MSLPTAKRSQLNAFRPAQPSYVLSDGSTFGSAVLGGAPADGCAQPDESVPLFLERLLQQYPEVGLLLCQTSKACQHSVLQLAPKVAFEMNASLPSPQLAKRKQTIEVHILARRPHTSGLSISVDSLDPSIEQESSTWLDAAAECSNRVKQNSDLYSLSAASSELITSLTHRSPFGASCEVFLNILPKMKSVTHLTLTYPLTWEGLAVLLDPTQAPQLQQLTIPSFHIGVGGFHKVPCQYTSVVITSMESVGWQELAELPLPRPGPDGANRALHITLPEMSQMTMYANHQGLNDTLVALLPQWRISGASIVVQRCPEMPDTCEPMALRIVFMQLTALHSEAGVLHLRGWRITPAILKTISQYKGQWKIVFDQCQFNQGPVKDVISTGGLGYLTGLIIPDQPLTDELLTMVLLHCPAITQMSVLEIAIQASYAQCRVRWQTLVWQQGSVGAATISMLPTGLRPYYVTPYPKLAWHYVVMPPSMLTKTQAPDTRALKPPAWVSRRKDAELNAFVRITASTSLPVHEQATALRAYLNPTTGLGHIVPLWFVELTGFTYTQELETLLGDAAQWYEARFAMPQTRCHPVDFRPWNRHVGLPDLARIELVGSEPGKPWSVSMMAVMWLTRFAREIQLQACELQCDMNDVKEVSTWAHKIIMLQPPTPATYHLKPLPRHMTHRAKVEALIGNLTALANVTAPETVVIDEVDITPSVAAALPLLPACRRVVLGPGVRFAVIDAVEAGVLCQQLARALPSGAHTEFVLHGTCGVVCTAEVIRALAGRVAGVRVVTEDQAFELAVAQQLSPAQLASVSRHNSVQALPPLLPPPPMTSEQQAAERKVQAEQCELAALQASAIAAALRAEADATAAAHGEEAATELRAAAQSAANLATRAGDMRAAIMQDGPRKDAVSELVRETAQLWAGMHGS